MAEMTDAATVTSQTTIGVSQVRQGLNCEVFLGTQKTCSDLKTLRARKTATVQSVQRMQPGREVTAFDCHASKRHIYSLPTEDHPPLGVAMFSHGAWPKRLLNILHPLHRIL